MNSSSCWRGAWAVARGLGRGCAVAAALAAGTRALGQTVPAAVFATSSATTNPVFRTYDTGVWAAGVNTGSTSGSIGWQILCNSPVGKKRALVTMTESPSLAINFYDGTSWGASTTLSSSVGQSATRSYAAAYESNSGNLMVVYRAGTSYLLQYRTYTTASPPEQHLQTSMQGVASWVDLASKPGSNEMVMVASSGRQLCAAVWNGSTWANQVYLDTAMSTYGKAFAVAYESKSGQAMVVWSEVSNAGGSGGSMKYATWNGTAWSTAGGLSPGASAQTMPNIAGGALASSVILKPNPSASSDEMLMAAVGTDGQISANVWDGAAWGSNLTAETNSVSGTLPRVDVGYTSTGGLGLLVWYQNGNNTLQYRKWTNGAWGPQTNGPDMGSATKAIHLATGLTTGEIEMLAWRVKTTTGSPTKYTDYNAYAWNSDLSVGSTTFGGPTAQKIPGINLPGPPTGNTGQTSFNYGNYQTATIAPGGYNSLIMGNYNTVTLTAGTYAFNSMNMGNYNTLKFDTSNGAIDLIFTNQGVVIGSSNTFAHVGSNYALVDLNNGTLSVDTNFTINNVDIIVHNQNATFGANISGNAGIYTNNKLTFTSGSLGMNQITNNVSTTCSAVAWAAGIPGIVTDLTTTTVTPANGGDPCALAGIPISRKPSIVSWTEVSP